MTDVMDAQPDIEEPGVPAEDPVPHTAEQGGDVERKPMRLDVMYLTFYNEIEPAMVGWTKDHRASIAMRQKAADIALNLVAIATR